MLTPLRTTGLVVLASFALLVLRRYRRRRITTLTLLLSLGATTVIAGMAIRPEIVFAARDALGIGRRPLSGLVVLLMAAVTAMAVALLIAYSRIDENHRLVTNLITHVSAQSAALAPAAVGSGIAVVIPALNEADNLGAVLSRMPAEIDGNLVSVIVVDDGSTDGTRETALLYGASVVSHPFNRGGGAALRLGYQVAIGIGAKAVVTMDADGQHDPDEMPALVAPILSDEADLVIGSRILGHHHTQSTARRIGVHVFNALISLLAGSRITDCSSGYRAMNVTSLQQLRLREDQFHTGETILLALRAKLRVREVPITIHLRRSGMSKKGTTPRYGWGFLTAVVRTWMK